MSVGKHLISEGAIQVNGVVADRWDIEIKPGDQIQVGKGKFARVK